MPPGMPPPIPGPAGAFGSGLSTTMASVVTKVEAMETACDSTLQIICAKVNSLCI